MENKVITKIGYVIECEGKFWTDSGERGCGYGDDISKAEFTTEEDKKFCPIPEYKTYGGSPYIRELRKGKFVKIKITSTFEAL